MAVLFLNGKIITGTGEVIEKGTVRVDDKRFTFVGPGKRFRPSKKDTLFDISGKSILPGLIDCHVHLCMDGSPDPITSLSRDSTPTLALKAALHALLTLNAGVTTVRDLGGKDYVDIAIRDGIETNLILGPRIICCGKLICMTGGHGWEFGREANGTNNVREAVREQLKAGADVVKLMATGGVMTKGSNPGSAQFTLEELTAGVEEARKAGRRTASHAQGNEGIKNALKAGIDSIEHGIFLDDEAIELMFREKVYLVPTLSAPYHILRAGVKGGIPPFVVEKEKTVIKSNLQSVQKAYQAQIPIAMGTDAGTPFNLHGGNLKELEILMNVGLTPMEAIVSATKTASEVLGMERKIGTIERGKIADLIVVDGNPLEDIRLLQKKEKILVIMREGRFFKSNLSATGNKKDLKDPVRS